MRAEVVSWALTLALVASLLSACGDESTATATVECATTERPIRGQRYRRGRQCLEREPETPGCLPAGTACPQLITYAADAHGRCYFFTNLCLPEGFTRTQCGTTPSATCPDP